MKKGVFITIYGVNNIGKSTQAKLLVERLKRQDYDPIYLKYPLYDLDPTGPKLNGILRSNEPQKVSEEELQQLFTQNRKDFEPELKTMLDQGKIIIAEDYTGTGIAWGMAKGLTSETMERMNEHLLKEDLSLLLVGKRAFAAKEQKHIHERDDALVSHVDHILRELAQNKGWHTIQQQKERDDTAEIIWLEVEKFLKSRA